MADKELKKNVAAIHIGNKLTLTQRKASNVLLLNAYENLLKQESHKIRIKDLVEMIGCESNNVKPLREALCQLATTKLEWNILDEKGKEKWGGVTTMLADAHFESRGYCTYSYSPALREKLYNPEIYARISLKVQKGFSSGHALALYENCLRFLSVGSTGWIDIKEFRLLLGVEETTYYHDFRQLNAKIIKPSVHQVNYGSNIIIEPEYRREKRKVVAIKFSVTKSPQLSIFGLSPDDLKEPEMIPDVQPEINAVARRLSDYGISEKQAQRIQANHDDEYIMENLDVVERDFSAGKVENLPRYTQGAMRDDYRSKKSPYEIKQSERKASARKRAELKQHALERLETLRSDFQNHRLQGVLDGLSPEKSKDLQDRFLQKQKDNRFFTRWIKEGFEHRVVQALYRSFLGKELLSESTDEEFSDFIQQKGEDFDVLKKAAVSG